MLYIIPKMSITLILKVIVKARRVLMLLKQISKKLPHFFFLAFVYKNAVSLQIRIIWRRGLFVCFCDFSNIQCYSNCGTVCQSYQALENYYHRHHLSAPSSSSFSSIFSPFFSLQGLKLQIYFDAAFVWFRLGLTQ